MVYVFLANGFEETEAIVPVDILRRGGLEVKTVGVTGMCITGAHGISVNSDLEIKDAEYANLDAVVLPGGMPGTVNLEASSDVKRFIDYAADNGKIIGAICAAPSILGHKGLLKGKKATCFTGFEDELIGAEVKSEPVIRDGNIVTGRGAGCAFEFAAELLSAIKSERETAREVLTSMKYALGGK